MSQICNSCLKNNKCLYTRFIIENIDIDEVDDIFDKYIDCQFEIEILYLIKLLKWKLLLLVVGVI